MTRSAAKGKNVKNPVFRFNHDTLVIGKKGKEGTIKDLAVPCKARVYYYPSGSNRAGMAYRIEVISLYKRSSKRWTVKPH